MVREHSSLPCVACGELFSSEVKLGNHLAREHSLYGCPCCDQMVSENLEEHLTSFHKSCAMRHPFLIRPEYTCRMCIEKFNTQEISSIVNHFMSEHNVKDEKVLYFLSKLHVDSDDDELTNEILVPMVNLFASSESSSEEDDFEQPDDHFGIDLLDVDPEDIDCVSESSLDDANEVDPIIECELCEEKSFVSPRELCFHLNEEHKLGWDKKSELDCRTAEYGCYLCTFICKSKRQLKTHLKNDHTHLGNKCRFCPVRFKEHQDRDKHQLEQHPDQQNFYQCPICQFVCTSTAISQKHFTSSHPSEKMESKVMYKCKICHQLMPSILMLRTHFSSWHLGAMIYRCRLCSATLKTKKTLNHHVKVVHSKFRKRDCSICNKEFLTKRAYTIHFRMKHSKSSKVGFCCRLCQKKFDTKEDRKLHYTLDHEGESPYHCEECGKGFASKSGMYGHRQLHTGTGISKCEHCGKEFTRKDSYNEHLLIHNGPRHKCPHCPKEFVQRSNLIRHIRIHTGEKPYQCTYCDKKFSDKGACNSHIRVHTKEETCSCPYCGQTFSKKQKLKYHIRKHTGEGLIECEICNKMFTNSFALKEHRIIHNRQTQRHVSIVHEPTNKSFQCSICPKKFSQQARLRAHVMTHSGVKHMKCLLCGKAYSVRKSLRRHLFEKHQIGPENPQYKQSFYTMSPEEAGLQVTDSETGIPKLAVIVAAFNKSCSIGNKPKH
ncbi:Hypothetical predicted protein [Cloeon dipterum]|uniref:C2H2-type domain-containing protein n=1 Tax=Cloeon dipterum TaxID=197152 RepID=A0A8S1DML2_9INSE|nr:Hypothetical predicted protein [Cloeon dipterum]